MTFTSTPITVKDSAAADKSIIAYFDGTSSAFAHPLLDNAGAIISPATSGGQATGNASLATIATNTTGAATAANQTSANGKLDTIIANTGSGSVNFPIAPTVQAAAYSPGFVIGGMITISGAARVNSGGGIVQQAYVTKKTALTAPVDLLVFHTNPSASTFTDRAALAVNVADRNKLAGVMHCTDLVPLGTPQMLQTLAQSLSFKITAGDTNLYVVPVMRGAGETFSAVDEFTVNLGILQD